jgi:hypothetical protein
MGDLDLKMRFSLNNFPSKGYEALILVIMILNVILKPNLGGYIFPIFYFFGYTGKIIGDFRFYVA